MPKEEIKSLWLETGQVPPLELEVGTISTKLKGKRGWVNSPKRSQRTMVGEGDGCLGSRQPKLPSSGVNRTGLTAGSKTKNLFR